MFMKGDEERGSFWPKERQSRSHFVRDDNYTAGMSSVSTADSDTDHTNGTE
jgi:hypothetical protein